MADVNPSRTNWPSIVGRHVRVLVGESVYEDATLTVTGEASQPALFLEFEADDLDSIMITLPTEVSR